MVVGMENKEINTTDITLTITREEKSKLFIALYKWGERCNDAAIHLMEECGATPEHSLVVENIDEAKAYKALAKRFI